MSARGLRVRCSGAQLPWFTVLKINMATTLRHNVLYVLVGGALLIYLLHRWTTTSGRLLWDRFKPRIPLVGGVLRRVAIMQFTQSLGTLLSGGIAQTLLACRVPAVCRRSRCPHTI